MVEPMHHPVNKHFLRHRIILTIGLLLLIVTGGTAGYWLIEGWTPLDALYMTTITLTTVGFGELYPLSAAGRAFTIALIVGGLGIFGFISSTLVNSLASGELRERFISGRRKRMLEKLHHHDIVCGFGRMGQHVCRELADQNKQFVIIDTNPDAVACAEEQGFLAVLGDATTEETLVQAGIHRARSLFAVINSDASNVFTVLTARALEPDLVIVARVDQNETISKLKRAGANEVIAPYMLGGRRMVHYVEQPGVVDFLDVVMRSSELELRLVEMELTADSPLVGKSLREANLRSQVGVNVLSVHAPGEPPTTTIRLDEPLQIGTHLIILGTPAQIDAMSAFASHIPANRSGHIEPHIH